MSTIPILLLAVARWILDDPRTLRPSNGPDACADYQFVENRLADAHASVDGAGTRPDGLGFPLTDSNLAEEAVYVAPS